MPVFHWKARTRQGQPEEGRDGGGQRSRRDGAAARADAHCPSTVKAKAKDLLSEYLPFLKPGIKTRDLVIFTRQFATMIDAGLPLVQCLDILGTSSRTRRFKEIIREVKADVEQGSTFADALRKHPKPFDDLYVNLVQAGEVGGILDTILNRLAVYLEKADALKRKVKGAMVYPTTVLVVAIGVVVLLLVKVIPVFEKMFEDFGGALPGPDADRGRPLALHAGVDRAAPGRAWSPRSFAFFWRAGAAPTFRHRDRRDLPEAAGLRPAAAQGGGGALHAHARHDDLVAACRSSTRSTSCARTAGNMVIEEALQQDARGDLRGQDDRRAARASRTCSRAWSCR